MIEEILHFLGRVYLFIVTLGLSELLYADIEYKERMIRFDDHLSDLKNAAINRLREALEEERRKVAALTGENETLCELIRDGQRQATAKRKTKKQKNI